MDMKVLGNRAFIDLALTRVPKGKLKCLHSTRLWEAWCEYCRTINYKPNKAQFFRTISMYYDVNVNQYVYFKGEMPKTDAQLVLETMGLI